MEDLIEAFIDRLACTQLAANAYNQYSYDDSENALRRANLRLYLHAMMERMPRVLLVGEAPGYRGCRLTGVPFTSPKLLDKGLDRIELYGSARGYQVPQEWIDIAHEQTATIMWRTLLQHDVVPLMWNSFPFHPFRPPNPRTNRLPSTGDLAIGRPFLAQLITMFKVTKLIAVGNVAEATLDKLGFACQKVRHPAQGGSVKFATGLQALFGDHAGDSEPTIAGSRSS